MSTTKNQLPAELEQQPSTHGYVAFPESPSGYKDMVKWAYQYLTVRQVLDIIDDETEIAQYLLGCGWEYVEKYPPALEDFYLRCEDVSTINNCNFRRSDALELIEQIVKRDGWDKVYAALEPHKPY